MSIRSIALPEPAVDDVDEPVDLVALQADDELINALAAGMSVAAGERHDSTSDDRLTAILAAWKAEVDAEPIPELLDVDTAVATLEAVRRRPSARARHLVPVAAAAAALVILLGGVSLGSYSAEPDDVLWPVAKVLYSERTTSVEAADRVEKRIALAKQAIAAGQPAVAQQELQAAAADLAVVRPEEGRIELVDVQDFLTAKAQETLPGVPTDPGAPLVGDSTRKVPPGAEITSPVARTSAQTSPIVSPVQDLDSPGPASPDSGSPVPPPPVDPRILQAPAPVAPAPVEAPGPAAPAPADDPKPSDRDAAPPAAPPADNPPPAENPPAEEQSAAPVSPAPPEPQPEPAPPGADGGAAGPASDGGGGETVGATAADSSTTAPSPTS